MNDTETPRRCTRRACMLAPLGGLGLGVAGWPSAQAVDITLPGGVLGSGTVVTQQRPVSPFASLRLGGSVAVELRQGEQAMVQVEIDDNLQPLVELEWRDTELRITEKKRLKPTRQRIVVITPTLNSIELGGSAVLRAEAWSAPRLTVKGGGSGVVKLQGVQLQTLFAELGGSSMLLLEAAPEATLATLTAVLGGSSGLRAGALPAREVTLQVGGSAQATVWALQRLKAAASGAGGVRYRGTPQTDLSRSGAATIRALGASDSR